MWGLGSTVDFTQLEMRKVMQKNFNLMEQVEGVITDLGVQESKKNGISSSGTQFNMWVGLERGNPEGYSFPTVQVQDDEK